MRLLKRFLFASLLLCHFQIARAASDTRLSDQVRFPVEKYQLKNGLTVLIHEDHKMPLLSYQQWFRVGSSHEHPGRTGLAHFFEHLMFKGTKKYPEGQIDRIIQMNGGNFNAFTTEDYTGYYTNLPSNKLELAIDIESDRMRNLLLTEENINSEREVVKEERRMRYDNSLYGSLWLLFKSTMYKTSPYRWPVIGYMEDLNATKIDEFREFYNLNYAPNDAVVVVAGDVKTAEVKKLIEKYYGNIPAKTLPPFKPEPETEQKAPRAAQLERDVQGVTILMAYPGVKAGDPDAYALSMLAEIMSSGTSSRLYKKLVYQNQLATQIGMGSENSQLAGEITVYMGLKPNADASKAMKLVSEELELLKREPVKEDELKKVRNSTLLGAIKGFQTVASKGNSLAYNEIIYGDYNKLFTDLDREAEVSADQIREAAKKYFVADRLTIVKAVPKAPTGSVQ
jgi:zinc protease